MNAENNENTSNDLGIRFIDTLSKDLQNKREQGHIKHEISKGIVCNYKKFFILIENKDHEVVGVLEAYTAFAEIYVEDLWVDEKYRGQGYGTKLIRALEIHFQGKGYNNINLVTSDFAAPEFYKKCGFEVEFVRKNNFNPQLTKTFFIKYFDNKTQTQGILRDSSTDKSETS
ncbi:MAG: GNAT family N-acetyltransferase [Parachlamydiales bacterium]|jgi:ribosomal protein S18 acetylase RimI-like enzyme